MNTTLLESIDRELNARLSTLSPGLLNGNGGCALYFANRFLQCKEPKFLESAMHIIEAGIDRLNRKSKISRIDLNSEELNVCWLIDSFISKGLLSATESVSSNMIVDVIVQAGTEGIGFKRNNHDLFFGFLAPAIVVQANSQIQNKTYIENVIKKLIQNLVTDDLGSYWLTPDPFWISKKYKNTINTGIPHGMLGILLFILRFHEVYTLDTQSLEKIKSVNEWLVNRLTQENNKLKYYYDSSECGHGKLAWCYGDLAIAFTLARCYEVLGSTSSMIKFNELLGDIQNRSIGMTGIRYFPSIDAMDICLCHGVSGITYIYHKLFKITGNQVYSDLSAKWLSITVDCTNKVIRNINTFASKDGEPNWNSTLGLLEGLSGVGLAMISIQEDRLSDWDRLLLLDRANSKTN